AGVQPGGIAVVDPDVGLAGAADRKAAEEIESLSLLQPAPALGDQPGVLVAGDPLVDGRRMEPGRVGRRRDRRLQVLARAAGGPEQEEVEHGEEAELE